MPALRRLILLSVLCLMIAGCSSPTRTVLATPQPPYVCRVECASFPAQPPVMSSSLDDWLLWGDDVTADYLDCRALHSECVRALNQRGGEQPSF